MKLYQISEDKEVEVIEQSSYRDEQVGSFGEATLQELLVDHPELIPSDDIDPSDPPRFVVLRSEAGVTSGSIDILLVDHKAVPTVVETKLIDNREIRRNVLAQGVEYLAHLKTEWTPERMLEEARIFWKDRQLNFEAEASQRLGFAFDDDFLGRIQGNIRSNRMRLIIASDRIPPELKQIIEFLNDASVFDVYGIEIILYTGKDKRHRILAPRLIGLTENSRGQKQKTSSAGSRWTYDRFVDVLSERCTPEELKLIDELVQFGLDVSGREIEWGSGKERGSFTARLLIESARFSLFSVYTNAQFSINLGWADLKYSKLAATISEKYRVRVSKDLGIDFDRPTWERGWPMTSLSQLVQKQSVFKQLIGDYVSEIRDTLK